MRRSLSIFLVLALAFLLCSCSKSNIESDESVQLNYKVYGHDIEVFLPEEEAEKIIKILDGNSYSSASDGIPSCGFDADVSFKIGDRTYAIARDTCGTVQDYGNLKFFHLSDEEINYIHALFEKYGGKFPCI